MYSWWLAGAVIVIGLILCISSGDEYGPGLIDHSPVRFSIGFGLVILSLVVQFVLPTTSMYEKHTYPDKVYKFEELESKFKSPENAIKSLDESHTKYRFVADGESYYTSEYLYSREVKEPSLRVRTTSKVLRKDGFVLPFARKTLDVYTEVTLLMPASNTDGE